MAIIDDVRAALGTVQDPDLHNDLVSLNMIRDLEITDAGIARFRLVLTTGACPVKKELEDQCRAAAVGVTGITSAEIEVTAEVPKSHQQQNVLPQVAHVIAISSGKGGVGKSTVTANIACALAATGARVGLLDADIYGPSMPMMMGINQRPYVQDKKMIPLEAHGVKFISMGLLLEANQAVIWRGPMLMGAIKQMLSDVHWGDLDYLLVDLPPGTGDVQMTLAQSVPLSGAVIVSTPQSVALLDATRGYAMCEKLEIPVFGLIENMSTYICPQCGHEDAIFDAGGGEQRAGELGIPFLGAVPIEPAVRIAGDSGTPVVVADPGSRSAAAFRGLAEEVARAASVHALNRRPAATAGS
jgi:ATP-binding protein involved in chromosome partitioning